MFFSFIQLVVALKKYKEFYVVVRQTPEETQLNVLGSRPDQREIREEPPDHLHQGSLQQEGPVCRRLQVF